MSTSVSFLTKEKTEAFVGGRRGKTDLSVYSESWSHVCNDEVVLAAATGNSPTFDSATSKWHLVSSSALVVFVDKAVSKYSSSIPFTARKYTSAGSPRFVLVSLTSTRTVSQGTGTLETTNNLVTSFSETTSDTKYPSEKLVKDSLDGKITNPSYTSGTKVLTRTSEGIAWGDSSSGEPTEYIKSASVSNNTLTLTKKDNTTVTATAKSLGGIMTSGESEQTVEGTLTVGAVYVGGTRVEVVSEVPESPIANTLYFVTGS